MNNANAHRLSCRLKHQLSRHATGLPGKMHTHAYTYTHMHIRKPQIERDSSKPQRERERLCVPAFARARPSYTWTRRAASRCGALRQTTSPLFFYTDIFRNEHRDVTRGVSAGGRGPSGSRRLHMFQSIFSRPGTVSSFEVQTTDSSRHSG
jgi:hypothetical protein